ELGEREPPCDPPFSLKPLELALERLTSVLLRCEPTPLDALRSTTRPRGNDTPTAARRRVRDALVRVAVLAAPSLGSTPFTSRPLRFRSFLSEVFTDLAGCRPAIKPRRLCPEGYQSADRSV